MNSKVGMAAVKKDRNKIISVNKCHITSLHTCKCYWFFHHCPPYINVKCFYYYLGYRLHYIQLWQSIRATTDW